MAVYGVWIGNVRVLGCDCVRKLSILISLNALKCTLINNLGHWIYHLYWLVHLTNLLKALLYWINLLSDNCYLLLWKNLILHHKTWLLYLSIHLLIVHYWLAVNYWLLWVLDLYHLWCTDALYNHLWLHLLVTILTVWILLLHPILLIFLRNSHWHQILIIILIFRLLPESSTNVWIFILHFCYLIIIEVNAFSIK